MQCPGDLAHDGFGGRLDGGRHPAVTAIPGASTVEQLESNVAAADIALSDDEYAALSAASDRFRPVTGRAAVPAIVRARLRR